MMRNFAFKYFKINLFNGSGTKLYFVAIDGVKLREKTMSCTLIVFISYLQKRKGFNFIKEVEE